MSKLRLRERRAFYRSRRLRELAAAARLVVRRKGDPDLAHLPFYDEWAYGPVQRDEALLLHALVRALRPATVVEIGFMHGDTAFNLLRALDDEARLYSFDIDPDSAAYARARCGPDPRFRYRDRSQDEIAPADIDHRPADLVFLDASHDLELNRATFAPLLELMADDAILAVHDTGTIPRALVPAGHPTLDQTERWVAEGFEHQPGERAFVNWVLEAHPGFSQVHVHSKRAFRHGITLLQRSRPLARP